jgi:hypothetical protein
MSKIAGILCLIILSGVIQAQEKDTTYWSKGGMISITVSQVSLTNWAAGGQSSYSGLWQTNMFANYKKGKTTWDNTLDLGYGILKQIDPYEKDLAKDQRTKAIKSEDKIDFASKFGRQASEKWYYSGLLNFRSQFMEGYNYPNTMNEISDFMAPAYITLALGMDYKPNDFLTVFISPITGKNTIVMNDSLSDIGAFGVDSGMVSRMEIGGYIKIAAKKDIMENVTIQTKLDLFSNYLANPQNFDVNWETLIDMKVNKYISVNIGTHLIYDDDIDLEVDQLDANGNVMTAADGITPLTYFAPRTQFKQVLNLGFSYKF